MTFDLIAFAVAASRAAIRRAYPDLSLLEQARLLHGLQFGPDNVSHVQASPNWEGAVSIPSAILPVTELFNRLEVAYFIVGSIASSAYSLPRTTYDVDIVAGLKFEHINGFVVTLEADYYIDRGTIVDAIARSSSFNLTHQATGINIDIFVPADRPFDRIQFVRARGHILPGADSPVNLASPEDILLNKLVWYELGNRVSDQQWRDVQALLRVQDEALDRDYLRQWAGELQISQLLEAAFRDERTLATPPDDPIQQRLF